MNYKLVKRVSQVGNTPILYDQSIFYFDVRRTLCKMDDNYNKLWDLVLDSMFQCYKWQGHLYPFKLLKLTYKVDLELGKVTKVIETNFSPAPSEINSEKRVIGGITKFDNGDIHFASFDLESELVTIFGNSRNSMPLFVHKSHFFFCQAYETHLLNCYNFEKDHIEWQFELPKSSAIPPEERYFGRDFFCWEDVLIVRIGRAGYMGLHIETGELLWENYEVYDSIISDGKLYSVGGGRFSIVNAVNGKTELMYNVSEQFSSLKLSVTGKFTLANSLIYFKNYQGKLGVFSIEERKIIWHHDLNTAEQKVEFGANEAPVVAGDKLMILDLNHVLHIFQRAN